jgi:hypothetical protein
VVVIVGGASGARRVESTSTHEGLLAQGRAGKQRGRHGIQSEEGDVQRRVTSVGAVCHQMLSHVTTHLVHDMIRFAHEGADKISLGCHTTILLLVHLIIEVLHIRIFAIATYLSNSVWSKHQGG